MSLPRIALALGDQAGIGPEIALKAALDPRVAELCQLVLVGDRHALEWHAQTCHIEADIASLGHFTEAGKSGGWVEMIDLDQFRNAPLLPGEIAAQHGQAAVDAAAFAIQGAMRGEVDAVVACPQTELAIHKAGIVFDGYPSFVARCTGTPIDDAFLMLNFDGKRIVHTTLHVSLRRAIDLITHERLMSVMRATDDVLRGLGIAAPRIALSGLNPHAGEGGMFGTEEIEIISPALEAARQAGIDVHGPFGADTMFHKQGFDAFIVMVHDQGHLAAKLLATNRTAGMTIGTPILFSSVAHGSALDIAGQNKASPEAVVEALQRLAGAAMRRRAHA
ncbi:MAG: 4-hydroxythreonine-4-phosphate dehydrogenase PdxA [Acetobacteraceae bacterium]|nr:4-hydroxythreonine-4-phosphate dehydrogenase PdxA [Acetobacteraceae bacterium]